MRPTRRHLLILAACLAVSNPAAPLQAQWAAKPDTTVRNGFGPQIGNTGARCRGACGGDCHPNTCEPGFYWECVDSSRFVVVRTYDCHTHQGCREHDDCLDECARRFPGTGRLPQESGVLEHLGGWRPERNFFLSECSTACHAEATLDYGPEAGWQWKDGYTSETHPPDGRNVFEYTRDAPGAEEKYYRCPSGTRLVCANGGAHCKPEPDEEPEEEPLDPSVVGVFIGPQAPCLDESEELQMAARVVGLEHDSVEWSVIEGPARIGSNGVLKPGGEGDVVVEAVSTADPDYRDRATVTVGDCLCSFSAVVSGDTGRGFVDGDWAVFSTRGQASIMGASAGGPEMMEDLVGAMQLGQQLMESMGGGQAGPEQERLVEGLQQQLAEQKQASSGSTLGINLIEGKAGETSNPGMGTAFKLDVLADGSIEPGFSGPLPVKRAAMHTGEFAEEGLAPMLYTWEPGEPGNVTLMVYSYDGERLRGKVFADLTAVPGIVKQGGGRPVTRFAAEFDAGAFNPLRGENVCLMAQAFAD